MKTTTTWWGWGCVLWLCVYWKGVTNARVEEKMAMTEAWSGEGQASKSTSQREHEGEWPGWTCELKSAAPVFSKVVLRGAQ